MSGAVIEREPSADAPRVRACPVCAGETFAPKYRGGSIPIDICIGCRLALQNPQPSDRRLNEIYGPDYFIGARGDARAVQQFETVKRATARMQLSELAAYLGEKARPQQGLRLLEIGCGQGNFLLEAQNVGYLVHGLDYSADAAAIANRKLGREAVRVATSPAGQFPHASFDICILADVIEHVRDPRRFLAELWPLLDRHAVVYIATPDLGSWSARLLGRHWMEYKVEHLFYFDQRSMKQFLMDCGFIDIKIKKSRKILTADYIIGHFDKFPVPLISSVLRIARRVIPAQLLVTKMKLSASGISVYASKP